MDEFAASHMPPKVRWGVSSLKKKKIQKNTQKTITEI
jgi:hypothetical protein